jgi:ketosteroid isomerase-like protein
MPAFAALRACTGLLETPDPQWRWRDTPWDVSHENIEMVRRGYEHFNRTGEPDYSVLDPEIVYDVSRRTFDPHVYHGHEGVREFVTQMREQWVSMRLEPQELIEAEDDVIVSVRLVGVGKESGAETTANAAHLWTVHAGKPRPASDLPDYGRGPRGGRG